TPNQLDLQALLDKLDSYIELVIDTQKRIVVVDDGNLFPLDLLSMAVSNRTIQVIEGFRQATESGNMLVSLPLVRLHIDTLLRWYATTLVENPHETSSKILKGAQLRDITDKLGNKLTDGYLVQKYSKYFAQLKTVYNSTSGYIHLSDKHMLAPVTSVDLTGEVTWQISRTNKDDARTYSGKIESTLCMIEITEHIIHLLNSWAEQKNSTNRNDNSESTPSPA
ncbi:MAG: hypothetical protein JNJ85_12100, partial [Candidatus Kapabacteria bacterium]|nr:hypothetical protein [Candidatus Kapabacteria bacterium]